MPSFACLLVCLPARPPTILPCLQQAAQLVSPWVSILSVDSMVGGGFRDCLPLPACLLQASSTNSQSVDGGGFRRGWREEAGNGGWSEDETASRGGGVGGGGGVEEGLIKAGLP